MGARAEPGARRGAAILVWHLNMSRVQGAPARIGALDPGDAV
ncbi:MAG: hypothetical protein ACRDWT_15355 [Jatrophihabitantaceae bacterium]